ncbi:hypothetical protein Taro_014618 [Colocasia esculenta]|uniref:Uncharacterized protein n=1 Tax=Colocasia esculenta TaxID=4460 RepID=A0A843UQP3_COLES|nr:hypothetical protein [Colocasia esculenta]
MDGNRQVPDGHGRSEVSAQSLTINSYSFQYSETYNGTAKQMKSLMENKVAEFIQTHVEGLDNSMNLGTVNEEEAYHSRDEET